MKKIVTISIIIILFNILFIILPKKNYSELENRYYQEFPKFNLYELENGNYTNKINSYLQDHFPLRNLFVSIKTNVDKLYKNKINGVYIGKDGYLIEEYNEFNKNKVIDILNSFSKKVDNVNLILIPTSIEINKDKLPKYIDSNMYEDLKFIYNKVNMNNIDIYNELEKSNYQTFYRTDHHWTIFGSYIAYKEYMKSQNKQYEYLDNLNIYEVTNNFYGTVYSKLNDYTVKKDTMYAIKTPKINVLIDNKKSKLYDKSYLNKKDKYSYYLGGNHGIVEITNNNAKDSILVIKDSYGNSFIPYLTYNYNKIYAIDLRYYQNDIVQFINDNDIDEVLILYNMNTITKETGIIKLK